MKRSAFTPTRIFVALGIGGVLVAGLLFYSEVMPEAAKTESTMVAIRKRLLLFARENDRLPKTLSELKASQTYDDKLIDAWGFEIEYLIESNNVVQLRSLGADHTTGGIRKAADIVRRLAAKNSDGSWNDEFAEWLEK